MTKAEGAGDGARPAAAATNRLVRKSARAMAPNTPEKARRQELHERAWKRWVDRRREDRTWIPLELLADFYGRKLHGQQERAVAEREGWRVTHKSLLADEFCASGRSRVLVVDAGGAVWWMTREALQNILPDFPKQGQPDPTGDARTLIDGYLSQCWVPTDLAVKWLNGFGVQIPDNLLPAAPTVPPAEAENPAEAAPASAPLRPASEADIGRKIAAAYDYADRNGMKPPNVKEIGDVVVPLLVRMGLRATKKQVAGIAEGDPFKSRRIVPGRRSSFLPFCAESFWKSGAES